ncbi:MAG: hypothetical protein R3281_02285 [Balneolaceae bacterium]|nr:hypothetical protein [Balneolaceae bacterium]
MNIFKWLFILLFTAGVVGIVLFLLLPKKIGWVLFIFCIVLVALVLSVGLGREVST